MPCKPIIRPASTMMIVGEAPGKTEDQLGIPFTGESGQELKRMLADAGICYEDCSVSNVFQERPPHNDLSKWWVPKTQGFGVPIQKGKYFDAQRYKERDRLYAEIASVKPSLIIALGNTAVWALIDKSGIGYLRGTIAWSKHVGCKVLPTYHPASILREWSHRHVAVLDLMKAKRESASREVHFPKLRAIIAPGFFAMAEAFNILKAAPLISYDIETAQEQITCIGFACKGFAITVPFVDMTKPGNNYWANSVDEFSAWKWVKSVLDLPMPKVTQNGLYDIQYLRRYGISPRNSCHDTMLLHHSIQPELPKSLAFIGSCYTDFPSWKNMRPKGELFLTNKKEE